MSKVDYRNKVLPNKVLDIQACEKISEYSEMNCRVSSQKLWEWSESFSIFFKRTKSYSSIKEVPNEHRIMCRRSWWGWQQECLRHHKRS